MMSDAARIREFLSGLDPRAAHEANHPPDPSEMYLPRDHEAALDPDRTLVVADRGMGKSFWSGALATDGTRAVLAARYPALRLDDCHVRLGFAGVDAYSGGPPSEQTIGELVASGVAPEVVWRLVVLRAAQSSLGLQDASSWQEYAKSAPRTEEAIQLALRTADDALRDANRRLVVVFDALDRLASSWPEINRRAKALLKLSLALNGYRRIRVKVFMRTDQAADRDLFGFADASKIRSAAADLSWERRDLYGLLFTLLARDSTAGNAFRSVVTSTTHLDIASGAAATLPPLLQDDEQQQKAVFKALAGPYMGANRRRGETYSWVHTHLADTHGHVSPRSFLIALRSAAKSRPPPPSRALDASGLKEGVREASRTRLDQLAEDYRWIEAAVTPLADLRLPCAVEELHTRWEESGSIDAIRVAVEQRSYLGPLEFETGKPDLLSALSRIGVLERRPDGRVNMPDIFRVAAGALKRGGVAPRR